MRYPHPFQSFSLLKHFPLLFRFRLEQTLVVPREMRRPICRKYLCSGPALKERGAFFVHRPGYFTCAVCMPCTLPPSLASVAGCWLTNRTCERRAGFRQSSFLRPRPGKTEPRASEGGAEVLKVGIALHTHAHGRAAAAAEAVGAVVAAGPTGRVSGVDSVEWSEGDRIGSLCRLRRRHRCM